MSDFSEELNSDVSTILNQVWSLRDGQVVPTTNDVALAGGGVKLKATILYADLARSTDLLGEFDKRIVAKVIKTFLKCSAKIIRKNGGHIRSFDGDRIMGIYIGDSKNSNAVRSALKINYVVKNILNPKLEAKYDGFKNTKIEHCVGIDTGEVLVVRSGIRNSNDLIWVSHAANIAAKLSELRDTPYYTYISKAVFDKLANDAKYTDSALMWEKVGGFYKSNYTWRP